MLQTPLFQTNPMMMQIFSLMGGGQNISVLEEGFAIVPGGNVDHLIDSSEWEAWGVDDIPGEVGTYGVCDSPAQFMAKYKKGLQESPRTFFVSFMHVAKDPDNQGQGGGWRWHKWGEYVGEGSPQCEYLDDEPGFEDGIYCFHICEKKGRT